MKQPSFSHSILKREAWALPRWYLKQGIQACDLLGIDLGGERAVQGNVDLLTQMPDDAIEGAEGGQLHVGTRQL